MIANDEPRADVASLTQTEKDNLARRIMALSEGAVMVVGDLMIDELWEGKPPKTSPESPVLILDHLQTHQILGGAANTAHNIAALGGSSMAAGVCGFDEHADRLASLCGHSGVKHCLVADSSRPTTVKTRILWSSYFSRQQMLRLDRQCRDVVSADIEARIIEAIRSAAGQYKAIVLSDYQSGVITPGVIQTCRDLAAELDIKLLVDSKKEIERFQGFTLIKPNQPETEAMVGFSLDSEDALRRAGHQLLAMTNAQSVLITLGANGMALFQRDQPMFQMPAFNKSEVFDVVGAGDTVISTVALSLVTGASFVEAIMLGNLAASIVVRKLGTATTCQKELLAALAAVKTDG